ncbi:MAG TPA: hypothetical protein PKA98_15325 [Acidimicrobiales bacterium]|nr:hypothetical protein [Acidimicrobiales bacterium]
MANTVSGGGGAGRPRLMLEVVTRMDGRVHVAMFDGDGVVFMQPAVTEIQWIDLRRHASVRGFLVIDPEDAR